MASGDPVLLHADEPPPAHPCASTWLYGSDLALLNYLLQDLRALMRRAAQGQIQLVPFETLTWEVHGLRRRTIVGDPVRLTQPAEVQIVGFFGDRRRAAPNELIEQIELQLLDEFRQYPGILSYSSVELVDNQWADLVVHHEPTDREAWRRSHIHRRAVDQVSPAAYHTVRIHNGCIPFGVTGSEGLVIESTKYWDFSTTPPWHAARTLPHGAHETVASEDADLR